MLTISDVIQQLLIAFGSGLVSGLGLGTLLTLIRSFNFE